MDSELVCSSDMFHGTSVLRVGQIPESFSESIHPLIVIQQSEITVEEVI